MDKGYPLHLINLLAKLYRKQLAKVKVAGTYTNRISDHRNTPLAGRLQRGIIIIGLCKNRRFGYAKSQL